MQTTSTSETFVIIAQRGMEFKYIARNFYERKHINCTIKINKAKKFNSWEHAQKFWEDWNGYDKELKFLEISGATISYQLKEEFEHG